MYFLYSVLLTFGLIALLPRFIYDALRHGKYIAGLRERMGQLPFLDSKGRPVIWLHCVSVGETQASRSLARAILERFPAHTLVVSTTTLTGQSVAREVFRDEAAAVFYFPFDWAWSTRRALRAINPSAVLIMETELWPHFLRECRARRIPVALVNGRISENSFRRYQWIRRFISRVVGCLDLALMQSDADAERIRALGLEPERVKVSGNVKFDAGAEAGENALTVELSQRFELDQRRPLIVAASTHAPEERIILAAFKQLRADSGATHARLLLAPRHPERFAEVAAMLESSGLVWSRRSSARATQDAVCDVILLDSIGELRAVYPLAEIVFVGGSIARAGGHNVLEPAEARACIVTGHHTFNFKAIMRAFVEAHALVQLPLLTEREAPSAVTEVLRELLKSDELRRTTVARARLVLDQNRGATERTIQELALLLSVSTMLDEPGQSHGAQHDAISA